MTEDGINALVNKMSEQSNKVLAKSKLLNQTCRSKVQRCRIDAINEQN